MTKNRDETIDQFEDSVNVLQSLESYVSSEEKPFLKQLLTPDRVINKELSIRMDSGKTKTFQAFRSQYNNALGPYKGGIRFHPEVTESEVKALSLWMMLKCSVAGIPYGGSKGGVEVNPKELSEKELERLSRAYVRAIAPFIGEQKDIPAPDVNTNSRIMAWMLDEYEKIIGRHSPATFTGKPVELGGSYGREKATGYGGVIVLLELLKQLAKIHDYFKDKQPKDLTIAIQGFGNVGYYFAKIASEKGFNVVAVSDSKGGIVKKNFISKFSKSSFSLDIPLVMECKKRQGMLAGCYCSGGVCDANMGKVITNEELLELPVDILVPAALGHVINKENAKNIRAKVIIEMANGPVTPDADKVLKTREIVVVPDILANAGGVIASYFEWKQNITGSIWSEKKGDKKLESVLIKSFAEVWNTYMKLKEKHNDEITLRIASYVFALKRIIRAMQFQKKSL